MNFFRINTNKPKIPSGAFTKKINVFNSSVLSTSNSTISFNNKSFCNWRKDTLVNTECLLNSSNLFNNSLKFTKIQQNNFTTLKGTIYNRPHSFSKNNLYGKTLTHHSFPTIIDSNKIRTRKCSDCIIDSLFGPCGLLLLSTIPTFPLIFHDMITNGKDRIYFDDILKSIIDLMPFPILNLILIMMILSEIKSESDEYHECNYGNTIYQSEINDVDTKLDEITSEQLENIKNKLEQIETRIVQIENYKLEYNSNIVEYIYSNDIDKNDNIENNWRQIIFT